MATSRRARASARRTGPGGQRSIGPSTASAARSRYTPRVRARIPGLLIDAALSAVALVIVHNLAFLLAYGSAAGAVLARTGHDVRWTEAVVLMLAVGATMLVAASLRVVSLVRSIHAPGAGATVGYPGRAALRAFTAEALGIATASGLLFLLQENLEHMSSGQALPGLGVLWSPEYPVTLPLLAIVAAALSALATLFRLRIAALERLLARAHTHPVRPVRRQRRGSLVDQPPRRSLLGRGFALRAPPPATA